MHHDATCYNSYREVSRFQHSRDVMTSACLGIQLIGAAHLETARKLSMHPTFT